MIISHTLSKTQKASDLRYSKVALKEKSEYFNRIVFQISLWLQAINLLFKIIRLSFKLRILSFQRRILLFQRQNLLLKQLDLLAKKVDHVLSESRGSGHAAKLLNGIECTHGDGDSSKPMTSSKSQT